MKRIACEIGCLDLGCPSTGRIIFGSKYLYSSSSTFRTASNARVDAHWVFLPPIVWLLLKYFFGHKTHANLRYRIGKTAQFSAPTWFVLLLVCFVILRHVQLANIANRICVNVEWLERLDQLLDLFWLALVDYKSWVIIEQYLKKWTDQSNKSTANAACHCYRQSAHPSGTPSNSSPVCFVWRFYLYSHFNRI